MAMPLPVRPVLAGEPRVTGTAIAYRLFDVGYEIHLDRAASCVASNAPERVRPVRGEAQAIQIRNPPLALALGADRLRAGEMQVEVSVDARIFDFGTVSLRIHVAAPPDLPWPAFSEFGNRIQTAPELPELFRRRLDALLERIAPAVERMAIAPVTEEYMVFRVNRLRLSGPERPLAEVLDDRRIVPLLLNEQRPLSASARVELLPHRFSYYADDLAILTWNNALIVEPSEEDHDIEYVLEYANAQLLELRVFDAMLDDQLPRMVDRITAARRGRLLMPRFRVLLADLQTLMADTTELVERVENALKVTNDVTLARVYESALEIFRGRVWRRNIDRKLEILRDTYTMLNAESQAARSEVLELVIVALIVIEIALALLRR
jgi:hypothetical protein